MSVDAATFPRQLPTSRAIALAAGYLLLFLVLDWVSYIRPLQGLNITPWNPQLALAIALLLWDARRLWLVWLSMILADLTVRGVPGHWGVLLAATAALTLCYAAIAWVMRRRVDPSLATRRDLVRFIAIAGAGSVLSAAVYVASFSLAGLGPDVPMLAAIARYCVGDVVGLVVMLPLLLVLMDRRRRTELTRAVRSPQIWLIALLIVVLIGVTFGREEHDHFRFFYLLLLPVVWASARHGLAGAVLAAGLTQIGLIVAVQSVPNQDLTVFELQVLMTAVAMTGLMLGVTVDERERAQLELKGSLRLAAAGQMAAALAHELSQPLTALSSYAEASRLLVASTEIGDDERLARLTDVSRRMASDAHRASDVVKRLREFFRTGSTQLQAEDLAPLLAEALQAQRRRAEALGVRLDTEIPDALPPVLGDRVQLGVVLRNVIANAVESAANAGRPGQVTVRARANGTQLLIEAQDNGPGIDGARLQTLFEPGPSDKPGGMGIGLSICRAIVEAHGGRLWAEPRAFGLFCVTLPIGEGGGTGDDDAT